MSDAAVNGAADRLMGRLLELTEQTWINSSQINAIFEDMKLKPVEAEIYLLRELGEIVRAFPLKIFPDLDRREKLIDAVQQALDDAVDREEQEL